MKALPTSALFEKKKIRTYSIKSYTMMDVLYAKKGQP